MTSYTEDTDTPCPDFIFEVSWEVCNKIGGIYTVISTKFKTLASSLEQPEKVIMVGPDVWKETTDHPDFEEDIHLMRGWREHAANEGLYFRIGRWKIEGKPLAVLVDFTSFFPKKDEIFGYFWEKYGLDSISGQWDYIEPAMFGYAAGKVIESFYRNNLSSREKVLAHFHEWMTGIGILYLKDKTPGIATVFTTHATVPGRSLAGNGRPLYGMLKSVNPILIASEFQVKSKYSLEKLSAEHCDIFTTVSDITATECEYLLAKKPDIITPNGFDKTLLTLSSEDRSHKRKIARESIFRILQPLFSTSFDGDTFLVLTSGRYEFRNKGMDILIDAIGNLAESGNTIRKIVAVIAVPAYHHGPRPDLLKKLAGENILLDRTNPALTHLLHDPNTDPVLKRIERHRRLNEPDGKVFICFIPTYLNGNDGIFNLNYYDFLCGFDLTAFPSYYEPWGYTPLESVAFGIPAITTSLAGFGLWVRDALAYKGDAVMVVPREDTNDEETTTHIEKSIQRIASISAEKYSTLVAEALDIANKANWNDFIKHYLEGYRKALASASHRFLEDPYLLTNGRNGRLKPTKEKPQWNKVLIKASYPKSLEKLRLLAGNLWWCWNAMAIDLIKSVNPALWEVSGNNPIRLLSMLDYQELTVLSEDAAFLKRLDRVYSAFVAYMQEEPSDKIPSIAYFSMEYGLHESLKTYSGGLGILAGDYLKEASDSNRHITGIGLLFRYGYFNQRITPYGDQEAEYIPQKFTELPIHPVRDKNGEWLTVSVAFPGRNIFAKVWEVKVGRVSLFLMDTDIEENAPHDRYITHQLYGGDTENRFKQEMLLGVGGIRLIEKLQLHPDVYHCNEGHAAFLNFERIRNLVQREFLTFDEALEVVRSSTLFTTHTPVPAGHDRFPEDLLRAYISHYPERFHITWEELISLGSEEPFNTGSRFSMSLLAINTSQEVNGVSRIHRDVSRKMFHHLYEGYFPDELHIGYVTNGVHYPSWTHPAWQEIHNTFLDVSSADQCNRDAWAGIMQVEDEKIWATRNILRNELLTHLRKRLTAEMTRRQDPPAHIVRVLEAFEQPALTIGFARRFATYKRAHLLFINEERLLDLLNNKERPLRFIFAGKAHPNDKAGQDLIKRIIEISRKPLFEGKIIFVENYDMELGRYLTQGCDIWMNTPTRPLEASGTSGEKAVMNGVLNLSVLDGWWAEGYAPDAGWALPEERIYQDQSMQDQLDAETIYNLLEEKIIPLFYERDKEGIPLGWIRYIKNNFKLITPRFTMKRMLNDYHEQYYAKLAERYHEMHARSFRLARDYAGWKRKVLVHWENITLLEKKIPDSTASPLNLGEDFSVSILLHAPGFHPEDLGMEVIFGEKVQDMVEKISFKEPFRVTDAGNGKLQFECRVPANRAGVFDYAFRLFPTHPLLVYRMDFPLVKWI